MCLWFVVLPQSHPRDHTIVVPAYLMGVYKQWNGLLEWWNTGMVEWDFFKVQYHFLHPINIPLM